MHTYGASRLCKKGLLGYRQPNRYTHGTKFYLKISLKSNVQCYSRGHKQQLPLCKRKCGKPRADTGLRVISDTGITAIGFLLNLNGTEEAKIILHG